MFRSAAAKLAHNSTIPALGVSSDLRPLQDLILAEKQVLNSLQRLSSDLAKNAEALRIWGSGEGDDLGDILGASATLLALWASSISQFSSHEHLMRDNLKAIRTREENLDDLKRRRKSVGAKAEAAERKLSKMGPEHKNLTAQTDSLNALRAEIRSMDSEMMTEEAALGDFKRTTTRVWMGLKFGALLECSEKGTIAGETYMNPDQYTLQEISDEQTQPGMARSLYYGRQKTEQLLNEAQRCINEVVLSAVPINQNPPRALPEPEQEPNFQTGLGPGAPQVPINLPQPTSQVSGLVQTQSEWHPQPLPQPQQPQSTDDQYSYLPVPQALGTGQFMDQPDSPASLSLSHQRYSSQPGQSTGSYQGTEEALSSRSVDDSGINRSSFGSMVPPGTGGRFATFPLKNRSYNLVDPQAPVGRESESFSTPVMQAMYSSQSPPGAVPQPNFSYEIPPAQGSPQSRQAPPIGMAVQGAPPGHLSLHHEGRNADDETGLAYDDPHDDTTSRHVRFGQVQGVDQEPEIRDGHLNGDAEHNQERQTYESEGYQISSPHPPRYEAIPSLTEVVSEPPRSNLGTSHSERSPTIDTRFQNKRRIPPPVFDPAEEERLLNAAAAREVNREMDALTFNPPIAQQRGEHTLAITQDISGERTQLNVSVGEQLTPPSAPSGGAPSPNTDSPVLPHPSYNTPPMTDNQSTEPSPHPSEPIRQQSHPPIDSQSVTTRHSKDEPPHLPPLVTQLPSSPYPNLNPSPGEYPRSLGAFPGPAHKSTSSLGTSGPPGARTISAAAFRRPQRMVSSDVSSSLLDVSPLSIKKRLPSSPYPQGREGSPMRPSSSGSGSPAQPAAPHPSQALPPIPTEDNYDYISAYVDSGAPEETVGQREETVGQRGRRQEDGRFSTDLERSPR
ncbi:Sphingolipid long chain base-responsive protein PIL1 [Termitomyces sp. J132]|nr:Sphingolipid long chain base-responsive protein PIL1 [Termitomyces sp. J132]